MKLSERMRDEAHTPWDILRTFADEVSQLEEEIAAFKETVERYFNDSGYEKAEDALRAYTKARG